MPGGLRAGEMATEAGSMRPTGMHSCYVGQEQFQTNATYKNVMRDIEN